MTKKSGFCWTPNKPYYLLKEPLDDATFKPLYDMLNKIKIPYRVGKSSRYNFPKHRSMVMGLTRERYTGVVGLSTNSLKYENIFEEILRIAKLFLEDDDFTSVYK